MLKKIISLSLVLTLICSNTIFSNNIEVNADDENLIIGASENTILLGDCNNDGVINILDLLQLKNSVLNNIVIDNADLNQDDLVNYIDILSLKKVILGLENYITIPKEPEYHFEDGILYFGDQIFSGIYTNEMGEDYLYSDGILFTGVFNNTIYVNGILATGWVTLPNGSTYYCIPNTNSFAVGVTNIDGYNYYFNQYGKLLTNCVIGQWVVDENGMAVSSLKSKAQNVLSVYGSTPNSIYNNYMRVYHRYKHISDSVTLSFSATNDTVTPQIINYTPAISSVNATGWACFALYTIDRSSASCYYLAALQDYLYREAGYTSRIVYGTQGSGVHYWNQVLVNGTWLNYDATNSGRGGKTNAQLSAINSAYKWCGYIVPDTDYNGCYYYKTLTDYENNNYTYLVNDIYFTN